MARSRRARIVAIGWLAAVLVGACGASAASPVTFVWPTSIDVEPSGSLLVVENGMHRLVRLDPATGRTTVVASGLAKAYAVARAPSGSIWVTDAGTLKRIDGATAPRTVARAGADVGPIAIAPNGDLYFTTGADVFRLPRAGGEPARIATGFAGSHGIAVARDGAILVSDTDANRVRRVDPKTGAVTTLMATGEPRGIDVAADGSIYVVDAAAHRVASFTAAGKRIGWVGPCFGDPYALAVTAAAVYVVDTSATGTIVRVSRDGVATTIAG